MIKYYLIGIFSNAPHPVKPTPLKKHNPLQRLAYLAFWLMMSPVIWISGWFYLFYADWAAWGLAPYLSLAWVAFFHTVGAFMILAFFIVHVYLITTGKTVGAHLKAMITGWEEVH